jgi:predicted lysophospholipase L1 biosynthesis ABC-type transport system permease subunit
MSASLAMTRWVVRATNTEHTPHAVVIGLVAVGAASATLIATLLSARADGEVDHTAVALMSTIAMVAVGLMCSAGFAVMAHRRLRQYGVLGSVGASGRAIRLAAIIDGVIVGVIGAIAGVALGRALFPVARSLLEQWQGAEFTGDGPGPITLVALGALAAATATGAAWWPARSLSRVPVVDALRSRRPLATPGSRPTAIGLAVGAVGTTAMAIGVSEQLPALAAPGMLGALVGVISAVPMLLRLAAALTSGSPLCVRMVTRDLVRQRSRSAPTVAAAALAIGLPLGVGLCGLSVDRKANEEAAVSVVASTVDGVTQIQSTAADPDSTLRLRITSWAVGSAFGVGVLAMGLALLRAEGSPDRRVLTQVGASSRLRRRTAVLTSTVIASVAVVVAVPIALLMVLAVVSNPTAGYVAVIPMWLIATVVVGAPLVAASGTWATELVRRRD